MPQYFETQPYQSQNLASLARLIGEPQRAQAQALREEAAIRGQQLQMQGQSKAALIGSIGSTLQNLGQMPMQIRAQRQQEQEQALRMRGLNAQVTGQERDLQAGDVAAKQAAALQELFGQNASPQPEQVYAIVGPTAGAAILKAQDALKDDAVKRFKSLQEVKAAALTGILAFPTPDMQNAEYAETRPRLINLGVDPSELPEQYDPAIVQKAIVTALSPKEQFDAMNPAAVTVADVGLVQPPSRLGGNGEARVILAKPPPLPEHSTSYKEWQDYTSTGGKLGFSDYQTMDANRKRSVSITNAATDDKMIDEAARNIIANPRDLTSVRTITSLRGDQRLKLFNRLKELNPSFNVGNIDRQIKFLDSYEDPKGRAALNRASMNNILMHSADLSRVNQEYRRSNIRLTNIPIAALAKQGGTAWSQFQVPLSVLKDEIGLYFAGGYAPTKDQGETWNHILNDTATPAQVEQFAKDIVHVGLRRADTHNEQFKTMMGYDDPNLITPDAKQAAQQLGLGKAVQKYGSGGQLGTAPSVAQPPPPPPQLPPGATVGASRRR